jgi:hypothetical protein
MKTLKVVIGVALLLASAGCSSQTLTRAKAKEVIEHRAEIATIWATDEELSAGVQKGLWVKATNNFGHGYYQMTPLVNNCLRFQNEYNGTLMSNGKFGIKVVEVTGISDANALYGPAGKVKVVKFTHLWNFAGCPDVVRTVITQPREHEAVLQLYDDGWRIEDWN